MLCSTLLRRLRGATIAVGLLGLAVGGAYPSWATTAPHRVAAGATISVVYSQTWFFNTTQQASAWWAAIKQQFERRYPGRHLVLIPELGTADDELRQINRLLRLPATTPDVLAIPTGPIAALVAAGALRPLNRLVARWSAWRTIPAAIQQESARRGQIYGVNIGNTDCGLLYARPLFRQAGLAVPWHPRRWVDVLTAARTLKRRVPRVHPLFLLAGTANGMLAVEQGVANLLLGTRQPTIVDPRTGRWVVRSAGLRDLFAFFHTLVAQGLLGPVGDIFTPGIFTPLVKRWLPAQRYGIALACNWLPATWLGPAYGGVRWPQSAAIWGATGLPTEFGQAPGLATMLDGWAYSIAARSRHTALAWDLIRLMSAPANSTSASLESGLIPATRAATGSPRFRRFLAPYNALFSSFAADGTPLPNGPGYLPWAQAMDNTTRALMQNPDLSGAQAAEMFAQQATAYLGAARVENLPAP